MRVNDLAGLLADLKVGPYVNLQAQTRGLNPLSLFALFRLLRLGKHPDDDRNRPAQCECGKGGFGDHYGI